MARFAPTPGRPELLPFHDAALTPLSTPNSEMWSAAHELHDNPCDLDPWLLTYCCFRIGAAYQLQVGMQDLDHRWLPNTGLVLNRFMAPVMTSKCSRTNRHLTGTLQVSWLLLYALFSFGQCDGQEAPPTQRCTMDYPGGARH